MDLSQGATVAVLNGELPIKIGGAAPAKAHVIELKKGEELTFTESGSEPIVAALLPEQYDQWDGERSDYEQRYAADSSYSSYPYYGRGDLNYYGAWYAAPGGCCGNRTAWGTGGIHSPAAGGRGTRERGTRGCRLIHGDGCPTGMGRGCLFPDGDGDGCRDRRGIRG